MAINGTGITITFQSGLFAEIIDYNETGKERAAIPTSHFGTVGAMTFMPGANHNPGQAVVQAAFLGTENIDTVMSAAAESFAVTYTDATTTTHTRQGFAISEAHVCPYEDRCVATWTVQLSGATTLT